MSGPERLPVVLNSKVWIPAEFVNEEACGQFHKQLFFDANCEKCPFYAERGKNNPKPTEACLGDGETYCGNYFGRFDLHQEKETNGVVFHGFPYGNKEALKEVYSEVFQHEPRQDRRPRPPFKSAIKFIGTLRDYQQESVDACFQRTGNLISKPRTGKTVMATELICRTGLKTLVLGGQMEWLKGFLDHFIGSRKQLPMTNVPELRAVLEQEERDNRKKGVPWNKKKTEQVIGFPKTLEDYERLDICLVTYQQLIEVTESGTARLDAIKDMFGFVVIDEVDTANANEFSTVVSKLNATFKLGVTATWNRKDGRQVLMEHLIGPILHTTETPRLTPRVVVYESQAVSTHTNWTYYLKFIEQNEVLFNEVVENVLIDLENGHHILIPIQSVDHTIKLYKEINKRLGYLAAAPLLGKSHMSQAKREGIIDKMQMGELQVLVGPFQLLRRGINIAPLSCIYEILPSNNFPTAEQRLYRILTPADNKPQPVIKYFLVNNKIHASCVKSEYYGYVLPELKPEVAASTVEAMKSYLDRVLDRRPKASLRRMMGD